MLQGISLPCEVRVVFFFFQAEDGIRDYKVTGVQTCALPISTKASSEKRELPADLEAAARQLRAATQYKDIQLWDVLPVHLQEGKDAQQNLRLDRKSVV